MSNYYVVCTAGNEQSTSSAKSLKEAKQLAERALRKAIIKAMTAAINWDCKIFVKIGCDEEGASQRVIYKKQLLVSDN